MKMIEFMTISDSDKVEAMDRHKDYKNTISDKGYCASCGKPVTAVNYCFGCHLLICDECEEKSEHYQFHK